MLEIEPAERGLPRVLLDVRLERLYGCQEETGVPVARGRFFTAGTQLLERELAQRLEHRQANVAGRGRALHEAGIHQRADAVQHHALVFALVGADGSMAASTVQPPSNTAKRRNRPLVGRREQIVAPGDGLTEIAVPVRHIGGAGGQPVQPAAA